MILRGLILGADASIASVTLPNMILMARRRKSIALEQTTSNLGELVGSRTTGNKMLCYVVWILTRLGHDVKPLG